MCRHGSRRYSAMMSVDCDLQTSDLHGHPWVNTQYLLAIGGHRQQARDRSATAKNERVFYEVGNLLTPDLKPAPKTAQLDHGSDCSILTFSER